MSALEMVLTRAMCDSTFANLLFSDIDKAVAEYSLSSEELASLKTMSRAEFEEFSAATPEERKSLGVHISSFHFVKRMDKSSPLILTGTAHK